MVGRSVDDWTAGFPIDVLGDGRNALLAVAMNGDAPWVIGALLISSATALSVICHSAYALTFSAAPIVAGYTRFRRWIDGTLGVFFTIAAFKLATSRS